MAPLGENVAQNVVIETVTNEVTMKLMSMVSLTKDTFKQMHRHKQCRHMRW